MVAPVVHPLLVALVVLFVALDNEVVPHKNSRLLLDTFWQVVAVVKKEDTLDHWMTDDKVAVLDIPACVCDLLLLSSSCPFFHSTICFPATCFAGRCVIGATRTTGCFVSVITT